MEESNWGGACPSWIVEQYNNNNNNNNVSGNIAKPKRRVTCTTYLKY